MKKFGILLAIMMTPSTVHAVKTFTAEPLEVEATTPKAAIESVINIDYELNALRGLTASESTNMRLSYVETLIRNSFPNRLAEFTAIARPLRDEQLANRLAIKY